MVRWTHVVVIWLLAVPWCVKAQANLSNRTFQWKFGGNFVASTFSECQTLPVIVEPLNSTTTDVGAAPYYLIAFEAGGIPSLSMIGSDPNNLTWENAHKRDSTLMLIVLDSNGNTGGVTPGLYNVTEGTETNCLPTLSDDMLPPTIASITPNITDRIETCSPWGLTVSGGTKPYQIVLSAVDSPIITNVTMGANDDVFTYIDRADPGEQLMASVVDATGRWGVSTGLITPYGSKDTDCVGLVSSSKTTAQIQQETRDRAAELAREKRDHQHLVIGVSVAVPVAAILIISTAIWWFLRRRSQYGVGTWDNSQDSIPRAWHIPPANANVDMRENHADPTQPSYNPLQTSLPDMDVTPLPAVYFDREVEKAQSSSTLVSGTTSAPQTPSAPLTPRERKLLQARGQHPPTIPSRVPYTASRSATSLPFATSAGQIDNNYNPDVQPDIIIQHRDGGAGIVQELPPPYADRSALSSASLSSPSASSLSNPSRFREHTD